MITINEKTSLNLTLIFQDNDGNYVDPTSLNYTIILKDTNEILKEGTLTDLTRTTTEDGPVYTLDLSKEDNEMVTDKELETHLLNVDWAYNNGTKGASMEYKFMIKNLAEGNS